MDNQKQAGKASISVGSQSPGTSPESGLDLQKLAELIRGNRPDLVVSVSSIPSLIVSRPSNYVLCEFFPEWEDPIQGGFIVWGLYLLWDMGHRVALGQGFAVDGGKISLTWCIHDLSGCLVGTEDHNTAALAVAHALVLALSTADQKQEPIYDPATFKGVNEFGICEDCGVGENGLCPPCELKWTQPPANQNNAKGGPL